MASKPGKNDFLYGQFLNALWIEVQEKNLPISEVELWGKIYTAEEDESARRTSIACENLDFLVRSMDGMITDITPKGREFIGKG